MCCVERLQLRRDVVVDGSLGGWSAGAPGRQPTAQSVPRRSRASGFGGHGYSAIVAHTLDSAGTAGGHAPAGAASCRASCQLSGSSAECHAGSIAPAGGSTYVLCAAALSAAANCRAAFDPSGAVAAGAAAGPGFHFRAAFPRRAVAVAWYVHHPVVSPRAPARACCMSSQRS
jgi:hypothetical protein